jgi:AraC-like DNA-binding protein
LVTFQALVILLVIFASPVQSEQTGSAGIDQEAAGPGFLSENRDEIPVSTVLAVEKVPGQSRQGESEARVNAQVNEVMTAREKQTLLLNILPFFLVVSLGISTLYYRFQNKSLRDQNDRITKLLQSLGIETGLSELNDNIDSRGNSQGWKDPRLKKLYEKIKLLFTEEKIYRDSGLSLGKVAEMAGSNRRYVSDSIYKATGMKFNDYVNLYRINESKKLLSDGEHSLSDIQFMCGFNSRTTFYSAFDKFTNMTPTQFRKSIETGS